MIEKTTNGTKQQPLNQQELHSNLAVGFDIIQSHPDLVHPVVSPKIMQLSRNERTQLAVGELHIGRRIHDELKRRGISVAWLAQQLCVERTGLYYVLRQNSISVDQLMRISAILNYNFMRDVVEVYQRFGL